MLVSDKIKYVGVNDHDIDLFEGQYVVPNGMSYNSYIILDAKVAILDSVDVHFQDQWINNIENVLGDAIPDYLVVLHMEPDHSGSIVRFMQRYQNAKIVSNKKVFDMMQNFFGCQFVDRQVVVGDGDTLEIGEHTLQFVFAPMVHWPEVMVAYELKEKVLFSADAFGKFGALDVQEEWLCEARRYYMGIVAKYGIPVNTLLKKAEGLDIKTICPLHGPVLNQNIEYYLDIYKKWANNEPENNGTTICYASVYGNTKKAVMLLKDELTSLGEDVLVFDLARDDMAEAIESAFYNKKLVIASPTYCNGVFPFVSDFITRLVTRDYKNRVVGFIENGSWAPASKQGMMGMMSGLKNITYTQNNVRILSSLKEDSTAQVLLLAQELHSIN